MLHSVQNCAAVLMFPCKLTHLPAIISAAGKYFMHAKHYVQFMHILLLKNLLLWAFSHTEEDKQIRLNSLLQC